MTRLQRFQDVLPALNQALIAVILRLAPLGMLLLALTRFPMSVTNLHMAFQVQTIKTKGRYSGRRWFYSGAILSSGFSDEACLW